MNPNITMIITLVAYILGSITKAFIKKIPNRFIPLQNVIIGVISALICYFSKIEVNILNAFVVCLMATMGAGGIADLIKNLKNETLNNESDSG